METMSRRSRRGLLTGRQKSRNPVGVGTPSPRNDSSLEAVPDPNQPALDGPTELDATLEDEPGAAVAPTPTSPPSSAEPVTPVEPDEVEPEPATPDTAPFGKNTEVGQWLVEESIGRLQGCWLLRVRHRNSDRIHATLKVAPNDDHALRRELVREGETLFPLDHPNIVTVRNLMLDHQPPFLEMEVLRGERLDHLLERRSSVYMAEALDIAEQLLGVLQYLHDREIYHRDLQPSNIMVGKDGRIRVIGFGRAEENPAPEPPLPPGDPAYLPPEWPDSPRPGLADLYATGSILFHLLTGGRPFGAPKSLHGLTIAAAVDAKKSTPFLDPGKRFREDLRSLVRHLTRREPSGRLSDARDALHRIQQAERGYAT